MCGITGFIHNSFFKDQWANTLGNMAKAVAHRGPDDEGVWFDAEAGVGLAHCRLSIIDLSKEGHQPMVSPSGRYVISYNGEIYNYRDIQNSLAKENIKWRGHSDTEVILAAIEAWGLETAVKQFVGMFAFALWDRKERILHLCRDRLGIKPLYYARIQQGMLFGSELKSFKEHPDFKPTIDSNALALYFRHNYIPAPYSIYSDTWKLLPGSILSLQTDTLQKRQRLPDPDRYWSAKDMAESGQSSVNPMSADEAVEQLHGLLHEAVGQRMVSDVPIGAFLSGGIDSTTVVALMQAQAGRKVRTFSIGFNESGYDEAKHAKAVAAYLGTDHTELYVTPKKTMDVVPDLPSLYDEPFSDSSQIPTYLLSEFTRDHVTVSLSGDGGDELFCGYNQYFWGDRIWRSIRVAPVIVREWIADLITKISPIRWDSIFNKLESVLPYKQLMNMPGDRLHKLSDIITADSPETMYHKLVSHWNYPEKIVTGSREYGTIFKKTLSHPVLHDLMHKMMFLDLVMYLPDDILTKVDRASMGVGLEARVPILDHRVVEFAWKIPLSMKVKADQRKWILRQVLYKYVPRSLVERPKAGFSVPVAQWLRGPLRDWAESLLDESALESDDILNPQFIQKKWEEHLSGRRDWKYLLWSVLMFQSWKTHNNL